MYPVEKKKPFFMHSIKSDKFTTIISYPPIIYFSQHLYIRSRQLLILRGFFKVFNPIF